MRRPVNRGLTRPGAIGPIVFSPSSFEQIVTALKISPEEYRSSPKAEGVGASEQGPEICSNGPAESLWILCRGPLGN